MTAGPGPDGQVNAVEITYVDPKTGSICRKDVFCDPQQWEWRWQARFLISAELINLLSEAFSSRQERFRQCHERLTSCRLGYLADLWRLRRGIENILAALPAEEVDLEELHSTGEIGPVHFFIPEHYLDSWTVEHLALATKSCKAAMEEEIHDLTMRLNVIGGGTWVQMLDLILSKGISLQAVSGILMSTCADPAERRHVENHVTGGLADRLDAMRPTVEQFELELEDFSSRGVQVDQLIRRRNHEIEVLEKALQALRQKRPPETPEARPAAPRAPSKEARQDPAEEARQLDANLQRVREALAAQVAEAARELERLRALAAERKARLGACREEELRELERRAEALEQRAGAVASRAQEASAKVEGLRERARGLEGVWEADGEDVSGLARRLSDAPPADPRAFEFTRLSRELRSLQREEAQIRKQMQAPQTRIRAIRHELRELYKRLGWDWDLSDSDDDDDLDDKPYWQRRKLAANGLTHFDERLFLYSERSYQSKRLKRHEARERSQQASTMLRQMTAKRYCTGTGGGQSGQSPDSQAETLDSLGPFKNHSGPVERDLTSTFQRVASSSHSLMERHQRSTPELGRRRSKTVQVQELRLSFESRLRMCTTCFMELLPLEGALGDQRKKLGGLLEHLNSLSADLSTWDDDAVGQQLDSICAALHNTVEEVASLEDHVHPICGALQHSTEFGDLRQCLAELCHDQWQLQAATRTLPSSTGHQPDGGATSGLQHPSTQSTRRVLISESWPDDGEGTMPSPPSKPSSALPVGPRSANPLPQLEQLADPVRGASVRGKAQRRRDAARPEVVNFGFRPDGAGEDSLENWSLFKVSKGSFGFSGSTVEASGSLASLRSSRSTSLFRESNASNRLTDSKAARFFKVAADCDFREYISHTQQNTQEMWRTASAPELPLEKKRGPSLPQLVSAPRRPRAAEPPEAEARAPRAGSQNVRSRAVRSALRQAPGAAGLARR